MPEQTGCLVFTMSLSHFQDTLFATIETFVTYTVNIETVRHSMQLYGGSIEIDRKLFVDSESSPPLSTAVLNKYDFCE